MGGGQKRAEVGFDFADVQIQQPVLDVVRLDRLGNTGNGEAEARFGALHLIAHGAQRLVVILRVLGSRSLGAKNAQRAA